MILRTGHSAAEAVQQLRSLLQQLQTPRSQRDEAIVAESYRDPSVAMSAKINAYLNWAQTAETLLRNLFADTDLSGGLFGERYWHIAGLPAGSAYGTRIVNQEIDHQVARLEEAVMMLTAWQKLGERLGVLLALDTNTFLQYRPYNEIPWTALTGSNTVRLILTMPVLDEIEMKKQGPNKRLRKRTRTIMPRIDKAFGEDDQDFLQVERDGKPMTGVTLEILRDPPGHRRSTTDMDAEFLDRVEFLQQAAGRPVTVVTGDTSMKVRARGRLDGLKRLTLPEDYRLTADEEQQDSNT